MVILGSLDGRYYLLWTTAKRDGACTMCLVWSQRDNSTRSCSYGKFPFDIETSKSNPVSCACVGVCVCVFVLEVFSDLFVYCFFSLDHSWSLGTLAPIWACTIPRPLLIHSWPLVSSLTMEFTLFHLLARCRSISSLFLFCYPSLKL